MFKEKHLLPATNWRQAGYLDTGQVDYQNSWAVRAKPNQFGNCLVFQRVVMLDGTVYQLQSHTASTRGIVAPVVAYGTLQREVRRHYERAGEALISY